VRTRISDDRVGLGYGVAQYIAVSGDAAILDEAMPFLQGPALRPGAHDDLFLPGPSEESAPLFGPCARGLDQAVALTGANGMTLIGTGDWTDGMNRAGKGGVGTSVWLGWLLITTIGMMAPLADRRDPARAGIEGLLGLNRAGQVLTLAPCFPRHWPRMEGIGPRRGLQLRQCHRQYRRGRNRHRRGDAGRRGTGAGQRHCSTAADRRRVKPGCAASGAEGRPAGQLRLIRPGRKR
jgi:hypothetical protein